MINIVTVILKPARFTLSRQAFALFIVASNLLFIRIAAAEQQSIDHALPTFDARYAVQVYGVKLAEANYKLSYTKSGYRFDQKTKLVGIANVFDDSSVTAFSLVDKIGDNLLLTHHSYTQKGGKKNRDQKIDIKWKTIKNTLSGAITGTVRGKKINLKTDSEIWEVLSFQIPLMIEAKSSVNQYPYKAILKGKIDTYTFDQLASEKITFAGKQYNALKMVRTDPRKDRQLMIWLLPQLHNMPVIIENYRDGSLHSRMQLEQVQFNDDKPIIDNTVNDPDNEDG